MTMKLVEAIATLAQEGALVIEWQTDGDSIETPKESYYVIKVEKSGAIYSCTCDDEKDIAHVLGETAKNLEEFNDDTEDDCETSIDIHEGDLGHGDVGCQ